MPRRPKGDSPEEQRLKGIAHKKARDTLKLYRNHKNYIGAYVILFSLFEDRLRAIAVLYYRDIKNLDHSHIVSAAITKIIANLKKAVLPKEVYQTAFRIASARNELIHEALYSIDAFTESHINELDQLEKQLDKIRRDLKKEVAKKGKSVIQPAKRAVTP